MIYKAIIFDLDGTLLDTIEDLARCFNAVVVYRGFPSYTVDEYKLLVGRGAENVIRNIIPNNSINENLVQACLAEFRSTYSLGYQVHTKPYPNIEKLLAVLTARGIICSVLSNKPDRETVECVRYFFSGIPFRYIQGQKENTPLKPDPQSTNKILKDMQVSAEETVFLGDTGTDMQTAVNAAVFPVGALWGFRSEQELIKSGAKRLVADPLEVLNLFI